MKEKIETSKKTRNIVWTIFGVLFMMVLVYATTIITDTDSQFGGNIFQITSDAVYGMNGINSLLGGTPSSGGIYFNQTVPQGKMGMWWWAYDQANQQNEIVGWIVCHYNSTVNGDKHSHCAIETLTDAGLDTHFAVDYGSDLEKSTVWVYDADFIVNNVAVFNTTGKTKLTPNKEVEIYPYGQSTYAFQVSNISTGISLVALGGPDIKLPGDNLTITQMAGTGNAFACVDTNGKLYRKATACA